MAAGSVHGGGSGVRRKPAPHHLHCVVDLRVGEGTSAGDAVPLLEAAAAAEGSDMLGDEGGVAAHRRLPAIVDRIGGGEPLTQEALGVGKHDLHPPLPQVRRIGAAEVLTAAEAGATEPQHHCLDLGRGRWSRPSGSREEGELFGRAPAQAVAARAGGRSGWRYSTW
jgi:hypothetical protein